jgi:hypothetical protein
MPRRETQIALRSTTTIGVLMNITYKIEFKARLSLMRFIVSAPVHAVWFDV